MRPTSEYSIYESVLPQLKQWEKEKAEQLNREIASVVWLSMYESLEYQLLLWYEKWGIK
jgi:hypothetical protein